MDTSTSFSPATSISSSGAASKEANAIASSTTSQSQDSPKTIYISFGQTGYVLTYQQSDRPSGVVTEHKGERGNEQKWTIEYGDTPDIIALRNVANGKYLYCHEARSGGKVGTGEKQWWRITVVKYSPPGGCRLAPIDSRETFLTSLDRGVDKGSPPSAGNQVNMTTNVSVSLRWDKKSLLT
jgi:hypothetical protein